MANNLDIPINSEELIEQIAEDIHIRWMAIRENQGWTYGPERNDQLKHHPSLIPYDKLSEEEKDVDRETAKQAVESIYKLGYEIINKKD